MVVLTPAKWPRERSRYHERECEPLSPASLLQMAPLNLWVRLKAVVAPSLSRNDVPWVTLPRPYALCVKVGLNANASWPATVGAGFVPAPQLMFRLPKKDL